MNSLTGKGKGSVNSSPAIDAMATDTEMTPIWRAHYRYLMNIGYRMLGSVSEADDAVQEAFIRLLRADLDQIADVRGWLVVALTRICLDQLRSARARHEVYVGPWLPEPVVAGSDRPDDPAAIVTLDDSVRVAMLLVLERLSPAERAAFVLHDIFQVPFDQIAHITGRTPAATRQLASRARRQVRAEAQPPRFTVDADVLATVVDRFIEAAVQGDLDALRDVLDPEVAGHTDTGGFVPAPRSLIVGREVVAPQFLRFLRTFRASLHSMVVNDAPGALVSREGTMLGLIAFDVRDGRIVQIHGMANPQKLTYAARLLRRPLPPVSRPGT